MIWQCVAQGFVIHVNKNAEKLCHLFVAHEGKKKIEVRRDEFVKGSHWEGALRDFSEEIRKNVGNEIHGILTPEFSTTGPVERTAAQVVMMDAFKEYMCTTIPGRHSGRLEEAAREGSFSGPVRSPMVDRSPEADSQ